MLVGAGAQRERHNVHGDARPHHRRATEPLVRPLRRPPRRRHRHPRGARISVADRLCSAGPQHLHLGAHSVLTSWIESLYLPWTAGFLIDYGQRLTWSVCILDNKAVALLAAGHQAGVVGAPRDCDGRGPGAHRRVSAGYHLRAARSAAAAGCHRAAGIMQQCGFGPASPIGVACTSWHRLSLPDAHGGAHIVTAGHAIMHHILCATWVPEFCGQICYAGFSSMLWGFK